MDTDTETQSTAPESSAGAETGQLDTSAQDANAATSTATHDATEASSPSKGEKPASLSEIIRRHSEPEDAEDKPEEAAEAPPAEAEAESEATPAEESQAEQSDKPEPEKKAEKPDDLKGLSKKTQERIHKLTAERDAALARVDEIKRYTGDEQGFSNAVQLMRTFAESPRDAVPMLEKLLEDAKQRGGLVVQADDIKQKLEGGLVDEESALELQQARLERVQAQQRNAAAAEQAMVTALNVWEENLRSRTPDYDNVSDFVRNEFIALAANAKPATAAEAVTLANKAYETVTGRLRKVIPQKQPLKVATSSGSSAKAVGKPRNILDIVRKHSV